ncbi:MAG: nitrogen regulation protein NR(I) [Alphaproteobacteria bacterium]|nr:MAG: nitrogen regulation protein NR(I) [Alphaproteobacteria bacterium]
MSTQTILVADDDPAIRTVLSQALGRQGYAVKCASNVATLWNWIENRQGDLVITDVVMPDENIFDILPLIRQTRPELPVIVMSAQNTLLTAVTATEQGAYDYLPKPFDLNELTAMVKKVLSQAPVTNQASPRRPSGAEETDLPIVGRSAAMQDVYRVMARLMRTDLTVMITGESGTGKELIARALHDYGRRRDKPFVAVNMAAIPRELIESELFGHEKGAFTGAATKTAGRFEQAEGGTLFLDEIGDMPFEAQTRLLRVLQEGEFTTVGGRASRKTDVRIIAATNRDLRQLIEQGLFREDLFYRLNVVPMRLPPLRDRRDDIPDLARHFLSEAEKTGLPRKVIDKAAMDLLCQHTWPGNIRELENLVRRLAALYAEDVIDEEIIRAEIFERGPTGGSPAVESEGLGEAVEKHLAQYFDMHVGGLPPPGLYERVLREVELPLIELSLKATKGNQIKASELLGVNRNTLRKKIRELDIEVVRGVK